MSVSNLLQRAIRDRYVAIDNRGNKVTYLPHLRERSLSNPEEQVQLDTYLTLLYKYRYPAHKIKVCERVQIGSSSREADIVVYRDDEAKDPFIIVECKKRGVGNSTFESAVDQGFSYAAVTRAEYVWVTSGDEHAYYEVWLDAINERERNGLSDIPRHGERRRVSFGMRRRLSWFFSHPAVTDTMVLGIVLTLSMLLLSKLAVVYYPEIFQLTRQLWMQHGMDFNWVYDGIVLAATALSLLFGLLFMRSHRLFRFNTSRKLLAFGLIGLILFVPAWYMGVSNSDAGWWSYQHYQSRTYKTVIYLWPYLKALPFQLLAIFLLIRVIKQQNKSAAIAQSQRKRSKRRRKR